MSQPAKKTSSLTPADKGRSHRFAKRMYLYSFLFLGELWAWMPALFILSLLVVCCVLFLTGNNFFLRAEENIGGEKKVNRDANQVDEERNRRASIFLPINALKINCLVRTLAEKVGRKLEVGHWTFFSSTVQ